MTTPSSFNQQQDPQKVHFISLGCPKNRIDTETMLAGLQGDYEITAEADDADVVVVNTCAFVDSAKEESVNTILESAELKAGKLQKLIVSGCLSQRYSEELARDMPEVDHFVGTNDLGAVRLILDQDRQSRVDQQSVLVEEPQKIWVSDPDRRNFDWELPRVNTVSGHSAYLKIAEGCSNKCAFCIIPTLRGPQRSRDIESVIREAEELVSQGVVELNLVAQDLTAYGYDLKPRSNLTALLQALEEVEGLRWIRLFYAYPRSFPRGLIDHLAQSSKIVPYLDIPLQHISDSVLRAMRRGTNSETIRKRIRELRSKLPFLTIRTSFIVGYPGETESDHQALLAFLKDAKFERVGAFIYSHEEGTPSYDLPDQIPEDIKQRRYDEVMFTQREIALEHNESLLGQEVEVLIERVSEENDYVLVGRIAQQAPDIDGVCYVGYQEGLKTGQIVRATVEQVTDYDLGVELIEW
ncbi:MAG: 30S ribosomal protein S12 methylthiotransferase RimO [Myxococcales bacterium]|nr:30S ribosomal protein S12 methylthiotransferase RimO [Myxococcales bacterium]